MTRSEHNTDGSTSGAHVTERLDASQRRAVESESNALLIRGAPATGKTEAIAARIVTLEDAREHSAQTGALAATITEGSAENLRRRTEPFLPDGEDPWIGTWTQVGARLLREEATAAGLDPFFEVLGPGERQAMLVERLEELPLRLHEIRGNPSNLLGRLLRRIDGLKRSAITSQELAEQARKLESAAGDAAERESARRELEFAELYAAHDSILASQGAMAEGDVLLILIRLLEERPDARGRIGSRFSHLFVEELELFDQATWSALELIGAGRTTVTAGMEDRAGSEDAAERFKRLWPRAEQVELTQSHRSAARIRFWRCENERAEAQAAAAEVENVLSEGTDASRIGIVVSDPARNGAAVGAALEERSIPFRLADPAAVFRRPEVRDVIAWLRALANPDDSAAVARAITRPPIQLPSNDLARLTTIARRRKLDLVSACDAALESPQFKPEARQRIDEFTRLHRAAAAAMEERRADVFVRRLIERIGLRRQRMFAAQAEVAERLISLSRISAIAAAWCRREPRRSTRDFVAFLTAVAESGARLAPGMELPSGGTVTVMACDEAYGREYDHVLVLGLTGPESVAGAELATAMTRACKGVTLSWHEDADQLSQKPSPAYAEALELAGGSEEHHVEQMFGPGESIHATYRMLREDVLESSWTTGRELYEPRLDIALDLNRALARYLELLKLAALAQRPEDQPVSEAIEAVNGILRQVASPEQLAELESSALDDYLLDEERERHQRRRSIDSRKEPSLAAFLPRVGEGLRLSATDLDLYLTCPLKYKFARVFALPSEPTINQRFGILMHSILDRFHRDHSSAELADPSALARLTALFESGWRRSGFGTSDDELQFRDRARAALRSYWERERESDGEAVWLEKGFEFRLGPHHVRGRIDRVDRLPSEGYELIDYKTGARKSHAELQSDVQLSLYRLAASRAWGIDAGSGSYYYVLDAEKVSVEPQPEDAERVERTVMEVGAGIMEQDFEPKPSPSVCSWCDFRLVCPAAEI